MSAGYVIGVDLGGTKLLAGVVDADLNVHHRVFRHAREGRSGDELLDVIVAAVEEAREAAGGEVRAVGLGVPSLVDPATGVANTTVHLPLRDVPLRDVMAERLGLPVAVDNDANAAMVAELRAGAARGASCAALLTLGTGIGGGMVVDGARRPRRARRRGRVGAHGDRRRRAAVHVREPRVPGDAGERLGAGARRAAGRGDAAGLRVRARAGGGDGDHGDARDRAGARRRPGRARRGRADGALPRRRDRERGEHPEPVGRRRRRGRDRGGGDAAGAGARGRGASGRWRRPATRWRSARRGSAMPAG